MSCKFFLRCRATPTVVIQNSSDSNEWLMCDVAMIGGRPTPIILPTTFPSPVLITTPHLFAVHSIKDNIYYFISDSI